MNLNIGGTVGGKASLGILSPESTLSRDEKITLGLRPKTAGMRKSLASQ